MGIKQIRTNFRVLVEPRSPGDLGFASVSGQHRSEQESEQLCEQIASDIRRHVDELPSRRGRGVSVEWDTERYCEHCDAHWTEKSETYNGGCCDEDQKNDPEAEAQQADLAAEELQALDRAAMLEHFNKHPHG